MEVAAIGGLPKAFFLYIIIDLRLRAGRQNAVNAVMLSCVQKPMAGIGEHKNLMSETGLGISKYPNQNLRFCAMKSVSPVIQSHIQSRIKKLSASIEHILANSLKFTLNLVDGNIAMALGQTKPGARQAKDFHHTTA